MQPYGAVVEVLGGSGFGGGGGGRGEGEGPKCHALASAYSAVSNSPRAI